MDLNLNLISEPSKECQYYLKNIKNYLININYIEGGFNLLFFNKLDNNLNYICTLRDLGKNFLGKNLFKFISDYEVLINVEEF